MLTGIVLAKNEEKNIGGCLKTLYFCDEMIVIDDFSSDKTVEIAKKNKAKIYKRHLNDDFASQRNFGLKKAKSEWVLFVDADERVTPELAKEIKQAVRQTEACGYYLKRNDIIFGKKINFGETARVRLLRLARRKSGFWSRRVHEVWQVRGDIDELNNPLLHYPHQTITEFLESINYYSSLHAQTLFGEREKTNLFQIIFFPLLKFFQNYFIRLGFLDEMPGLIVALMMSFHSFLARGKLYLLWQKGPIEYRR